MRSPEERGNAESEGRGHIGMVVHARKDATAPHPRHMRLGIVLLMAHSQVAARALVLGSFQRTDIRLPNENEGGSARAGRSHRFWLR